MHELRSLAENEFTVLDGALLYEKVPLKACAPPPSLYILVIIFTMFALFTLS